MKCYSEVIWFCYFLDNVKSYFLYTKSYKAAKNFVYHSVFIRFMIKKMNSSLAITICQRTAMGMTPVRHSILLILCILKNSATDWKKKFWVLCSHAYKRNWLKTQWLKSQNIAECRNWCTGQQCAVVLNFWYRVDYCFRFEE